MISLAIETTGEGLAYMGFWIGLGLGFLGFCIGCGIEQAGKRDK